MGIIYDTLIKMNEDPVDNPPAVAGPADTDTSAPAPRAYKTAPSNPSQTVNAATNGASEVPPSGVGNQTPAPGPAPAPAGPAPEGAVLKAQDIPWDSYNKNYVGADLIKKDGKWTTQATPQWNGLGARAGDPAWIAQLEKIYSSKNPNTGAGSQNAAPATPAAPVTKGPGGEPLVKFKNSRGQEQIGYWQRTSGKGTMNFVPVPGGVVQESETVGYMQDPVLARIVELARR